MSPTTVRTTPAARTQVATSPEASVLRETSAPKGGERRVREGCREGRREAKFVRTCPGSQQPSFRVAAGSCGGALPLSLSFPPSLPPGGAGGGEVTSAPRPAPSPAAPTGFSGGSASRAVAAASPEAVLGSRRLPRSFPRSVCPTLPCGVCRALPGAGEPVLTPPRRPRSPTARTSPEVFPASPLRQRFPRLKLQVMVLMQLKFVATCHLPGFCRKDARTVYAHRPGRLVPCSPPTSLDVIYFE